VAGLGLAPTLANPLAFVPAFLVSFAGHHRYSFDSNRHWRDSLPRWLATSLTGFALNQGLYAAALACAGERYYLPLQALVTLLVAAVTYMAGKFWAFAR
jgi:putative flippase GtrA